MGGRRDTDGALDRGEALYRNLHWNCKTSDHKVLPNKSMSSSANPKDRASYQHDVYRFVNCTLEENLLITCCVLNF